MILQCYGESSFTMICSRKLDHMGMCSQSSYSARTSQLLLLKRVGLSHEGFILMVITVSCHLQMPTHGCQMLVPGQFLLYFIQHLPSCHLWYSYWLLHSELCPGKFTNAVCWSRTCYNFPYSLDCNKAYGSPADGVECVYQVLAIQVGFTFTMASHCKSLLCYLFYLFIGD